MLLHSYSITDSFYSSSFLPAGLPGVEFTSHGQLHNHPNGISTAAASQQKVAFEYTIYIYIFLTLSGVITNITVYLTIRHNLLPTHHFSSLPNQTTSDSLLYLIHCVKVAWRTHKVVTIIFLDIANAFPNAVTSHLLKNMTKLGYPSKIVDFFNTLLSDRKQC